MPQKKKTPEIIESFDFFEGRVLASKYEVISFLGAGWEGEVYKIRERATGIERAAKFFFPHRNLNNRALKVYAKKLHKLRDCNIVIKYHTQDSIRFCGQDVPFLVSEYVEGELLKQFLERQPGKRITAFPAVHLLHALAVGMESIHQLGEYHGDLHTENIVVRRHGLGFDFKILDLYHWDSLKKENIRNDVLDMVRIFYDASGGAKHYHRQPPEVKAICCGLKRSLILKKFKTASRLRAYLENMEWRSPAK